MNQAKQEPTININIVPEGAQFTQQISPNYAVVFALTAEQAQQFCKMWLESRKQLMDIQRVVQQIPRSRSD